MNDERSFSSPIQLSKNGEHNPTQLCSISYAMVADLCCMIFVILDALRRRGLAFSGTEDPWILRRNNLEPHPRPE